MKRFGSPHHKKRCNPKLNPSFNAFLFQRYEMSRKNKKHEVSNKSLSTHALDSAGLADKAKAALETARYKEAIECYKELLKRERKPEWVEGLASCYAGRARDLAGKGMVKEALVLWRNRADLCGKLLADGFYIDLLLQMGEQEHALRLLSNKDLPATILNELETRMAAFALFSSDHALAQLDAESLLRRHNTFAREALAAYQRGDFVAMREQLQSISFRSPYRDLRPILKSLSLLGSNVTEALAAIERVPANGPFERLIEGIRVAALPGNEWFLVLCDLDANSQKMVLDLKGYPESQHRLILEIAKMGGTAPPLQIFDLINRYRHALPETAEGLLRRLMPHVSDRQKAYGVAFNKLSGIERDHIHALRAELRGDIATADKHWVSMADELSASPDTRLQAGLIMRHMAIEHEYHIKDGKLCSEGMLYLKKSVEFDPEDKEGYLKLIAVLCRENDLVDARKYLDSALSQFPNDAGVLLAAVETALVSKAFKKALGYAKKVLELDPINSKVRSLVGQAHISHARKLIKSGNMVAAHKELDDADEWMRSPTERWNLKLLRAIIQTDADAGNVPLRELLASLDGFLVGSFYLLLEANQIGYVSDTLLRQVGVDLSATPTTGEVVAFVQVLNAGQFDEKILRAAMKPLQKPLARAAKEQFSESDQQMICEVLHRCKEIGLVVDYASAALKRWPNHPVFVYFHIAAKSHDNSHEIKQDDWNRLVMAEKEAHRKGDQRTVARIDELLRALDESAWMDDEFDDNFPLVPDFDLNDPRAMLEMILAMKGEKGFLNMARSELGAQVYNEIKKQVGGNSKKLVNFLMELMLEGASKISLKMDTSSSRIVPALNEPTPKSPESAKTNSLPPFINPNQKNLFDD